jgi:hypothetical protein
MLTKIVLATALILGPVSATMATEDNDFGGFRVPGSMDGVNPVFHPSLRHTIDTGAASANASASCEQRFKSYDPQTGTYLGFDGKRHPCS